MNSDRRKTRAEGPEGAEVEAEAGAVAGAVAEMEAGAEVGARTAWPAGQQGAFKEHQIRGTVLSVLVFQQKSSAWHVRSK